MADAKVVPIEVAAPIRILSQEEFHALDRRILGLVFQVHNEFGRFLDENVFKSILAARCLAAGIQPVLAEVLIRVTHDSFVKDYSMDLLLESGLMLEAKCAETLTPAHRSQGLNYLFLTGMKHGRLVNLRAERAQHEFLSTTLDHTARRQFTVADFGWRAVNEASAWFQSKLLELLRDWGAFLEVNLYRQALIHFLGGEEFACRSVDVHSNGQVLGHQRVTLLAEDTAFALSAVTQSREKLQDHQQRFLRHTSLRYLQWVNLNHHSIEFTTLVNDKQNHDGQIHILQNIKTVNDGQNDASRNHVPRKSNSSCP